MSRNGRTVHSVGLGGEERGVSEQTAALAFPQRAPSRSDRRCGGFLFLEVKRSLLSVDLAFGLRTNRRRAMDGSYQRIQVPGRNSTPASVARRCC